MKWNKGVGETTRGWLWFMVFASYRSHFDELVFLGLIRENRAENVIGRFGEVFVEDLVGCERFIEDWMRS